VWGREIDPHHEIFTIKICNVMKNCIDISWPISNRMTRYKNKPEISLVATKTWENNQARELALCCSSHTGTHIDAPAHFIENGLSIDAFAPDYACGSCRVLDFSHVRDVITRDILQEVLAQEEIHEKILLFKTRNSLLDDIAPFDPYFVYVDASAAALLSTLSLKAVGIDYVGIERNQPEHETHVTLLHNNILIIEGLRLADVDPGSYALTCLPLFIPGADAAPARAILNCP
jgi:arylformamidase